nr:unnamed protein product [Callosobruchus chinensis]
MADLSTARDVENKMEQRLANLKNQNGQLKNKLERAVAEAQAGSIVPQQLQDENSKMKQQIAQLESEIDRLKEELNKVIGDTKKGASGISAMQDNDETEIGGTGEKKGEDESRALRCAQGCVRRLQSGHATKARECQAEEHHYATRERTQQAQEGTGE